MADNGKCKHDICTCSAKPDSDYCSDHCKEAEAQGIIEIRCDCGHAHCEA